MFVAYMHSFENASLAYQFLMISISNHFVAGRSRKKWNCDHIG